MEYHRTLRIAELSRTVSKENLAKTSRTQKALRQVRDLLWRWPWALRGCRSLGGKPAGSVEGLFGGCLRAVRAGCVLSGGYLPCGICWESL